MTNIEETITRLVVRDLDFNYDRQKIIQDISLDIRRGEFVGLIGPNGSGKSTLLKNIYRVLSPSRGEIFLDEDNVHQISHKTLAQKLGVMGQENYSPFDFTVEDMVAMGRHPYKKLFDGDTDIDKEIVNKAIEQVGLTALSQHYYRELSGGEKQRVIIARVLTQQTDFLILDEPTNHLDISYQFATFELVKSLKVTVMAAVHDLNMAAMYCDRICILKKGRLFAIGTPEEVLTSNNISNVYGIDTEITKHHLTGKLNITFIPKSLQLS